MRSLLRSGLLLIVALGLAYSPVLAAPAAQFPAFEQLRLPKPDPTQKPTTIQGAVMEVKNGYTFVVNEIKCYLVNDTMVDGVSVEKAKFRLKAGTRVKVTGYRYGSANLVVEELTIL